MKGRAVFLDRDGTLMEEVEYCRDPAKVRLLPGVTDGLARLQSAGWTLIMVTNQSGIGRGWITPAEYEAVHAHFLSLLPPGLLTATWMCPDAPGTPSERRKPAPGMLLEAARDYGLDLAGSWLVGDKEGDLECARRAGSRPLLVRTGYGHSVMPAADVAVAEDFTAAVEIILRAS